MLLFFCCFITCEFILARKLFNVSILFQTITQVIICSMYVYTYGVTFAFTYPFLLRPRLKKRFIHFFLGYNWTENYHKQDTLQWDGVNFCMWMNMLSLSTQPISEWQVGFKLHITLGCWFGFNPLWNSEKFFTRFLHTSSV